MNRFQVMAVTGAAAGMTALSSVGVASAQDAVQWRVEDGGNGHWYELVISSSRQTWQVSRDSANASGGHLATVTTAAEDVFIRSWLPPYTDESGGQAWLGAYQDRSVPDYSEPFGGWRWVTGEAMGYQAWSHGGSEANYPGADFLALAHREFEPGYFWNDLQTDYFGGRFFAIVEWSADCNSDGIVDYGQIRAGELVDVNANNIPDCCEQGFDCRFNAVEWRVTDGGNGHWYEVRSTPRYWHDADVAARSQGAYLASVTSIDEQLFIQQFPWSRIAATGPEAAQGAWLGATRRNCTWTWVTDEPWSFTHWAPMEPSGGCYDAQLMMYVALFTTYPLTWDDCICPPDGGPRPAIIEYSADCNSDGIVDYGQIRAGELVDANVNNIPDCCEQAVSCAQCPGDVDESGTVNGVDLAAILAVWGSDGGKYPSADTNNDGVVNGADLATVLGSWGSCE